MGTVNPFATRRVALCFDERGNPQFHSTLSPEDFCQRALCVAPPRHVIPIVFVPGIMGSNLRSLKRINGKTVPAWRPPNGLWESLGEVRMRLKQKPEARQLQLHPSRVEVDDGGFVSIPRDCYNLDTREARRRGWGEVHWESYGPFLLTLERALNDQYEDCGRPTATPLAVWQRAQRLDEDTRRRWGARGEAPPLSPAAFQRLDDYYYPVWACGYNWMESNERSARRLLERIEAILAHYQASDFFIPEGRVILVTHSMGGLVARRAAQQAPERILGVVHGVLPALGAPVTYRRFRAGTESNGLFDLVGKLTAVVLGWSAADTTCVLAHSPGALELLPTRDYPPGWLRVKAGTHTLLSLPETDPYSEIYAKRVQDVWWGMVDETLIDPAGLVDKKLTPFDAYENALTEARAFHDTLGLYFHPHTYAYFGVDPCLPTFHTVCWEATSQFEDGPVKLGPEAGERLRQARATDWDGLGRCEVALGEDTVPFRLGAKDGPGDGTVPEPSGAQVERAGLRASFRLQGVEHASSYRHPEVWDNVCYCIARLVEQATPVTELPQSKKEHFPCPDGSAGSSSASSAPSPGALMT